jgi:hypothetical protein
MRNGFRASISRSADPAGRKIHLPEFALHFVFAILLAATMMSCGVNPSPTPVPTSPPLPSAPLPSPTNALSAATPTATVGAAPAPPLKTETLHVTTMIAIDDLEPMVQDLQNLSGVQGAQGGGQDVQVTYDPDQVHREQIIGVIENHGYHVQEP